MSKTRMPPSWEDLNLLERQNLARAAFLKLSSRNLGVGDDNDPQPAESFGEPIGEVVALSTVKLKISKLASQLKNLALLMPIKQMVVASVEHAKLEVYDSENYDKVTQQAHKAQVVYEVLREDLSAYLRAPTFTKRLSRYPAEWNKVKAAYDKVKATQAVLNFIIQPLQDSDKPRKLPPGRKEQIPKEIEDLTKELEDALRYMKDTEAEVVADQKAIASAEVQLAGKKSL